MHFGIFIEEARPGASQAAAFQEKLALVDASEAWGLDAVWLGEIHFNPGRSILSAPLILAAAIAARTRRLRVGTAVRVLPLANPLRIAEEVATVDHLSGGRFEFGIGRSGAVSTYDVLGIPYAESQARFQEALEIIREAWTGQPFSYQGAFYQFENVTVAPRPLQVPHPPMRMAANTPDTFRAVGQLGLPIFVGLRDLDISELATQLQVYRAAWKEANHAGQPSVFLRIPVYIGATEKEAVEEPADNINRFFKRQLELMRAAVGRAGAGPAERRQARADRLASLSYDDILRTRVAFGTASGLIDRLTALRAELGVHGIVAELNPGGAFPVDRVTRSLHILTHEVMPAFK
jgi:alkanesulfonate monooxygenase SsuD/methylene tetrahydromethanopterin reductase-like flavin-dependent oxidoreductase (luciferase family)